MGGHGWGAAAPILRVRDLDASLTYYLKVLCFRQDWGARMREPAVSRPRGGELAQAGAQPHP